MRIPVPDGISLQMRDLFTEILPLFSSRCEACLFLTFSGQNETFSTLSSAGEPSADRWLAITPQTAILLFPTSKTLGHVGASTGPAAAHSEAS